MGSIVRAAGDSPKSAGTPQKPNHQLDGWRRLVPLDPAVTDPAVGRVESGQRSGKPGLTTIGMDQQHRRPRQRRDLQGQIADPQGRPLDQALVALRPLVANLGEFLEPVGSVAEYVGHTPIGTVEERSGRMKPRAVLKAPGAPTPMV